MDVSDSKEPLDRLVEQFLSLILFEHPRILDQIEEP